MTLELKYWFANTWLNITDIIILVCTKINTLFRDYNAEKGGWDSL